MAWSRKDEMESEETRLRGEKLREARATARAKRMSRGDAGRSVGSAKGGREDDMPGKRDVRTENRGREAGEDVGVSDRDNSSGMDDARMQERVGAAIGEFSEVQIETMKGFYDEMKEAEGGQADVRQTQKRR